MRYLLVVLALLAPALLDAQATVRSQTRLLHAPSGRLLATMHPGAEVRTGVTRAGATQVTVEGWLHGSLIGAARDSFPVSVNARSGARLRAAPQRDARVLALLQHGMGLHQLSRRGDWVRVRRTAWVSSGAVERREAARPQTAPQRPTEAPRAAPGAATQRGGTAADAAQSDAPRADATDSAPGALDTESARALAPISQDMTPVRRVELASSPAGGAALGAVEPGSRVTPLAREAGWVRVRVEGWVPGDALQMADDELRTSPSAADLRADPDAAKGKAVRWQVQVLSFQTADPLRRDMDPDEPYLLARGPGPENSLLYLALPRSLESEGRGIPALTTVVITGRVRVARSVPAGVPIIDVQSISRR